MSEGVTSGLLVFIMTHGVKGKIVVEGQPKFVIVEDIIKHMSYEAPNTPKVKLDLDILPFQSVLHS
jgi:hypothetical protein